MCIKKKRKIITQMSHHADYEAETSLGMRDRMRSKNRLTAQAQEVGIFRKYKKRPHSEESWRLVGGDLKSEEELS